MSRIARDEMYLGMAALLAQRSTCLRGNVGALLVSDNRPVGGGYNGAPSRQPKCLEVGCDELMLFREDGGGFLPVAMGCQRTIHAELNAVAWAARHGVKTQGATMYCTHAPCGPCAKAIIAAGIVRFVYKKSYRAERLDILLDAGLTILWHDPARSL